ncbi:MAG TPA: sigma-54 dependent transcriptional regulator [Vicinamibacterales bacterium]|nr:sigma-54 dependent transcriptional regulator [Vicinamibacterales bacterium]
MTERSTHLLLVDDESALRTVVAERLAEQGFDVTEAESGERAIQLLSEFAFDIVISDLRLPGVDGQHVIESALERYPGIIAIVVTGYGTVKDAVDAIKRGAADFVAKPFQFDELLHVLHNALEQKRLKNENAYLRSQLDERFGLGAIIGRSARMRTLFQLIETVATTTTTILINGETGTGKEMVARSIHQTSPRRQQRFVALNCSAIPETLLEAELFGHMRGAFTGAVGTRVGRIEQADRGTLFLDEVGTMAMSLQMKLLRVLQEREFERIGDSKTIKVDVRVVAATNADLAKMVKDGTFREDLYYRLNVIQIELPPLRDRKEDIPLLVHHFVAKYANGATAPLISQDAMRRLMAYPWPGNVRQLENAVERAMALLGGRSTIEMNDLPPEIQSAPISILPAVDFPDTGVDLPTLVEQIERDLIGRALSRTGGNKAAAAGLLNLKRTTLVEKLKRLPGAHH